VKKKKKRCHVHVYKVSVKFEGDVTAGSVEEALEKIQPRARAGKLKRVKKDCNFVAFYPAPRKDS